MTPTKDMIYNYLATHSDPWARTQTTIIKYFKTSQMTVIKHLHYLIGEGKIGAHTLGPAKIYTAIEPYRDTEGEQRHDSLCNRCGKWFDQKDAVRDKMEFDGDIFEFIRCPNCNKIWGDMDNKTYGVSGKIIDLEPNH